MHEFCGNINLRIFLIIMGVGMGAKAQETLGRLRDLLAVMAFLTGFQSVLEVDSGFRIINAQRLVVTQEPGPLATVAEAPPEPKVLEDEASRPTRPSAGAVWVSGHWAYGPTGYTWIAGRYVTARRGHVFVPPRWAESEGQHLYFNGFYVPYGVYVRSHFNKYFYSGRPKNTVATNRGPYWPVGAPTRANRPVRGSDPYWPVGARR